MHRVRVVGDVKASVRQLLTKSYRPRTRCRERRRQVREASDERLWASDERLPKPLSSWRVEGGEDLSAARVQDGQVGALSALGHRAPECVECANSADRHAGASRQAPGCGQPDTDADKGTRPTPDRDPPHLLPAAARLRRALHLGEQGGRVSRASIRRQTERCLVQHLATARCADGSVGSRRVETDDRLLLGGQLSQ